MEALGLARREINVKDQRRFSRVTAGELVKDRERAKHMFGEEYRDQRDAIRRGREGELVVDEDFIQDGTKEAKRHRRPDSTYSYNSY
jgi:hypothetical protein